MNLLPLVVPLARQKLGQMSRLEKNAVLRLVGHFCEILETGDPELITGLLDQYTDDPKIRDLITSEFIYESTGK